MDPLASGATTSHPALFQNSPHRTQTRATGSYGWCYKSPSCLPCFSIISSIQSDLHSPLHMHKPYPSFATYSQKHFLHEMSLPLLAWFNLSFLPTTLPHGSSNVIFYFVGPLSLCVFPREILAISRSTRSWGRQRSTSEHCLSPRA